jgi:hypothetical protein
VTHPPPPELDDSKWGVSPSPFSATTGFCATNDKRPGTSGSVARDSRTGEQCASLGSEDGRETGGAVPTDGAEGRSNQAIEGEGLSVADVVGLRAGGIVPGEAARAGEEIRRQPVGRALACRV